MKESFETIVVGAGQAGLSTSYFLKRGGAEHIVLERHEVASSWRRRWDSFTLVTPNAMNALPDFPSGGDPAAFLTRDEVVDYLERFAQSFGPPIRSGVNVSSVRPDGGDGEFAVRTSEGTLRCRNVVIATGTFQQPRLPPCASDLPGDIVQLHSSEYRAPDELPPGAVLVVGSGQSGAQIADDLREAGRKVVLSVSRAERLPRRYRGRDTFDWLRDAGLFERTIDMLDSPAERFEAHPHVSGRGGGRTLDLRRFGRDGMTLVGKVEGVREGRVHFHDDLRANLAGADDFAAGVRSKIDQAIEKAGLRVPAPTDEELAVETWEPPEIIRELSLEEAGIRSVVWATGYRFDFSWIEGCDLESSGYPVQRQGVTSHPGLYFVGLHWLNKHKSALFYGVAEDAEHVARHIMSRA